MLSFYLLIWNLATSAPDEGSRCIVCRHTMLVHNKISRARPDDFLPSRYYILRPNGVTAQSTQLNWNAPLQVHDSLYSSYSKRCVVLHQLRESADPGQPKRHDLRHTAIQSGHDGKQQAGRKVFPVYSLVCGQVEDTTGIYLTCTEKN